MALSRRQLLKTVATIAASACSGASNSAVKTMTTQTSIRLRQTEDRLLSAAIASKDIPGAIALVTTADDVLYEGAFGERAFGRGQPMSMDTVLWIASMTKPVVAVAAMQLVERGELRLDEPASQWLPYLGKAQVLRGFDEHGQPVLRDPKSAITLRQLLTHTAGFTYDLWDANLAKYHQVTGKPHSASGKRQGLELPLAFDPGTQWAYGINFDWVGLMIEAVSGMTLGQYLKMHVTDPLGMNSTGFKLTPNMRLRLAPIHKRDAKSQFNVTAIEAGAHAEFESGGAGLYSTALDYAKFMRMILNQGSGNGNQLLRPETVALITQRATGSLTINRLRTQSQAWSTDVEFFVGTPKSWGLGFMRNEGRAPTGRSAGSLSWAGIGNTFFWIDPEQGVAGLILMQLLPFMDKRAVHLFTNFERTAYDTLT